MAPPYHGAIANDDTPARSSHQHFNVTSACKFDFRKHYYVRLPHRNLPASPGFLGLHTGSCALKTGRNLDLICLPDNNEPAQGLGAYMLFVAQSILSPWPGRLQLRLEAVEVLIAFLTHLLMGNATIFFTSSTTAEVHKVVVRSNRLSKPWSVPMLPLPKYFEPKLVTL